MTYRIRIRQMQNLRLLSFPQTLVNINRLNKISLLLVPLWCLMEWKAMCCIIATFAHYSCSVSIICWRCCNIRSMWVLFSCYSSATLFLLLFSSLCFFPSLPLFFDFTFFCLFSALAKASAPTRARAGARSFPFPIIMTLI